LRGFHTIFLKKLTLNLSNNAATPNTKNKASNNTFFSKTQKRSTPPRNVDILPLPLIFVARIYAPD